MYLSPAHAAAIAVFAALLAAGGSESWAQDATCPRPAVIRPYEGSATAVKGDSGTARLVIEACSPGRLLVVSGGTSGSITPEFGPHGSGVTAGQSVNPCALGPGNGSDLPRAELWVLFTPEPEDPGFVQPVESDVHLVLADDNEKPTLKTTSQPRKGSKVRAGERISIRMEASEEYGEGRTGWQSGVKKIQLRDESLGRDVPPHYEDSGPMRPCAQKPWKQWLQVTYTVPPDPPPVIRLRATAWDFTGNEDEDTAEFPTGDWYGTIRMSAEDGGGHKHFTEVTFSFDVGNDGTLMGRALANITNEEVSMGNCLWSWAVSPNPFDMDVSGRRSGDSFDVALSTLGPSTVTATIKGGCVGGHSSTTYPYQTNGLLPLATVGTRPELHPDGRGTMVFRVPAQDGGTNSVQLPMPAGGMRFQYRINLHQEGSEPR